MANPAAFTQLIQANSGILHKVVRLYLTDAEDQKDAIQEITLQAWKSFPKFRADAKFSTWLYKVALNTVLTLKQKEAKWHSVKDLEKEPTGRDNEHPELERLYAAIRQLNPTDRMVIALHLDDYAPAEIADITGMTANSISVRLHRIKQQLTERLKG